MWGWNSVLVVNGLVVLMFLVCRIVIVGLMILIFLWFSVFCLLVCGLNLVKVSWGCLILKLCCNLCVVVCVLVMISLIDSSDEICVSGMCVVIGIICSDGLVSIIMVFLLVML